MISVAIDGPAGAGKSTMAKGVAEKFGYIYVDTGALYRTIGLYVMRKGVDTTDAESVTNLLSGINIDLKFENNTQQVILNGENVSNLIRTPEVSMAASNVSAISAVRSYLFDLQKNMAVKHNVIMDGRDIGTVVLPNADVKIFLTASPEERANRRFKEMIEKGQSVTYEDVLKDIKRRDYNDSNREIAPLKPAEDAITLDTTFYTLEESIEKIENIIKEATHIKETY